MIKHIRWTAIVVTALIVMALPMDGLTAAADASSPSGLTTRVSLLESRVEALRATVDLTSLRLEAAMEALRVKRKMTESGLARTDELRSLEVEVAELRTSLARAVSELHDMQRLAKLASPVDVELKEASLRQAAEALTKATGLKIAVDERIKDDPQKTFALTLKVRAAPLGQVLEQIADGARILIAPGKEGVVLVPQPAGSINGTDAALPSITWPWSSEWAITLIATPEGDYLPVGQRWLGLIEAVDTAWTSADLGLLRRPGQTTAPAAPAWAEGGTPQPVITSMSPNTFLVGEPGTNDKSEPGMWLTFYSIDSGKMIPGIKYFHRFTAPAAPECGSNNDL